VVVCLAVFDKNIRATHGKEKQTDRTDEADTGPLQ